MLYVIGFDTRYDYINAYVKIGISTDVRFRLNALQAATPFPLKIFKQYEFPYTRRKVWARRCERYVHRDLERFRVSGEWFRITVEKVDISVNHFVKMTKLVQHSTIKNKFVIGESTKYEGKPWFMRKFNEWPNDGISYSEAGEECGET